MNKYRIAITYVVCLLLANIAASKMISIFGLATTGGIIIFPLVYILNDVIAETFNSKETKEIIKIGLYMNILMTLVLFIVMKLPYPTFWEGQEAFENVFNNTPRIVLAGFISYYLGSNTNAYIMNKMHKADGENRLFKRIMISTLAGEIIDAILFIGISFIGTLNCTEVLKMIITQVVFKSLYELIFYPITKKIIHLVKE